MRKYKKSINEIKRVTMKYLKMYNQLKREIEQYIRKPGISSHFCAMQMEIEREIAEIKSLVVNRVSNLDEVLQEVKKLRRSLICLAMVLAFLKAMQRRSLE